MATDGPDARVEVFVDHSNFYHGLREQYPESRGHFDFPALVREVLRGRRLTTWNHYCGEVDPEKQPDIAAGQQLFHAYLKGSAASARIPLQLKLRPLIYPSGFPRCGRPPVEKGIDALIVQDLIVGAFDGRYDVAILLSGDRDFGNVLDFLKSRFRLRIETLYANSRRHLYDMKPHCFDHARILDKHVYRRIARKPR